MPVPSREPTVYGELLGSEGDRRLGPFRLLRKLGQGGFAPVWLAEEAYEGQRLRDVAVKLFFLPAARAGDPVEAARWRNGIIEEARALCRVEHPNVVRFYSLHQDLAGTVVGLSMEYVAGDSLDIRLTREGHVDERAVIEAGIAVAWALAAVHQAGLVHRDVKPANIIEGATGYKLIDFGIVVSDRSGAASSAVVLADPEGSIDEPTGGVLQATVAVGPTGEAITPSQDSANAASQPLVGTLGFIAPECFLGAPASPASDLYALGATLFTLLAGKLPGEAVMPASPTRQLAASLSILRGPVPRVDTLLSARSAATAPLAELVALLLDADPDARPRYADWVARELEQIRALLLGPEETSTGGNRSSLLPPSPRAVSSSHPPAEVRIPRRVPVLASFFAEPPLVGRDEVLAVFDRAAADVQGVQGGVRVVLLTGPVGIGRTRLLDAAIARAAFPEMRVLRARCSPERRSPLGPIDRALRSLRTTGAIGLGRLEGAIARALSPGHLPGEHEANSAVEGVEDALLRMSAGDPIHLSIDDLQWADAHTLELCRMLIERAGSACPGRLLVTLAVRDEPHPTAPLRALLGRVRGRVRSFVNHVGLGPLGPEETAQRARALSPISPELERAVVRGSGGVPFFVMHAMVAWQETGAIAWSNHAFRPVDDRVSRGDVPGVAELLEARLSACVEPGSAFERPALRALAAVALYGGGLGMDLLLQVTGAPDEVESAVESLVAVGLLTVSGDRQEVFFAQEMMRQAALNLLRQKPWFSRLHRGLLDTLARREDARSDATFLAMGYEKLGDPGEARIWLARAREGAALAGLFVEAAELGDRLAALTQEPIARATVELDVVKALVLGRRFVEARGRLQRMAQRSATIPGDGRPALEVRRRILVQEVARGLREPIAPDTALPADAAALGDPALVAEALLAVAGASREERALALAGEAIALVDGRGDTLELTARVRRFELNYTSNRCDRRLAEDDLQRALAIAARTSSVFQQVHIAGDLAIIEAELGQLDGAIERLRHLTEQAEIQGMRGQLRLFLQNLSALLLRADRDAEAAETARRTATLAAEAGDTALAARALSLRARALQRTGELGAALESVDEAERLQRGDGLRALTLLRRAEIYKATSKSREALADARMARAVAREHDDADLTIGAALWEALHLAKMGQGTREALTAALADAERADVTLRVPTRLWMDQARAWLAR